MTSDSLARRIVSRIAQELVEVTEPILVVDGVPLNADAIRTMRDSGTLATLDGKPAGTDIGEYRASRHPYPKAVTALKFLEQVEERRPHLHNGKPMIYLFVPMDSASGLPTQQIAAFAPDEWSCDLIWSVSTK